MMRTGTILLTIAVALLVPACDRANDGVTGTVAGGAVVVRTVDTGSCLEVADRHGEVFRNAEDWRAFWDAHVVCSDGTGKPRPAPTVPAGEMLVGVFWGGGYSGCSNALGETIESVRVQEGVLVVKIGPLPQPDTTCTALVYPMQVIATERVDLPVVFDWP